jgi:mono/diheme cytochrome c family protein
MNAMPRWITASALLVAVLALLPLALIARSRAEPSTHTRLQPIQDMGVQPKFLPQAEGPLFADGRAMRLPVEGAVARGELSEDDHLFRGRVGAEWAKTFPMEVNMDVMRRGQERFNIFCAVCHGQSGNGKGTVAVRAQELAIQLSVPPLQVKSYHADEIRKREVGHIFNTITHGYNSMPPYGAQISVKDRWAIVAYVRALQRSQNANLEDVPADKREDLR